jgi:amidophosphoribosyltransferase
MSTTCGLVGVVSPDQSVDISDVLAAMRAIQHSGMQSWGIASLEDGVLVGQAQAGMLPDQEAQLKPRPIAMAIGHVGCSARTDNAKREGKMATGREGEEENVKQPVLVQSKRGEFAVAFNGCLGYIARQHPGDPGATDVLRVAAGVSRHPSGNWTEAIHDVSASCVAAFSVIVMTVDGLYYVRGVRGYRPLVMADIEARSEAAGSASWKVVIAASESAACEALHNRLSKRHPELTLTLRHRAVQPGSLGRVRLDGSWNEWAIKRHHRDATPGDALNASAALHQRCSLEAVHFMRGGGHFDELDIDYFREECGRELARQDKRDGNIYDFATTLVVGCPRGGIAAGRGYAAAACLPYAQVLRATSKVTRSPSLNGRVVRKRKQRPQLIVDGDLRGKIVIFVDDFVVRAMTVRQAVRLFREAGASEVHVRIAAPSVRSNCV